MLSALLREDYDPAAQPVEKVCLAADCVPASRHYSSVQTA